MSAFDDAISRCFGRCKRTRHKVQARWGGWWGCRNLRHGGGSNGCKTGRDQRASDCIWMPQAVGFGVTVFLGVKLATKGRVSLEDFERAVRRSPKCKAWNMFWACMTTACGWWRVILPDFERVLRRRIMTLPGVGRGRGECSAERRTPTGAAVIDFPYCPCALTPHLHHLS